MCFLPERRERGKGTLGIGERCGITIAGDVTVTEPIAGIGFMGGYCAGLVDCAVKRSGTKQASSTAESG